MWIYGQVSHSFGGFQSVLWCSSVDLSRCFSCTFTWSSWQHHRYKDKQHGHQVLLLRRKIILRKRVSVSMACDTTGYWVNIALACPFINLNNNYLWSTKYILKMAALYNLMVRSLKMYVIFSFNSWKNSTKAFNLEAFACVLFCMIKYKIGFYRWSRTFF